MRLQDIVEGLSSAVFKTLGPVSLSKSDAVTLSLTSLQVDPRCMRARRIFSARYNPELTKLLAKLKANFLRWPFGQLLSSHGLRPLLYGKGGRTKGALL